jgi:phosphoribosylformylglycinamidine synthase
MRYIYPAAWADEDNLLSMLMNVKTPPAARRYCDAEGASTEAYPFNPNGSPEGIAALTSPCGRHLALMPHPERCFLAWQNPWSV